VEQGKGKRAEVRGKKLKKTTQAVELLGGFILVSCGAAPPQV